MSIRKFTILPLIILLFSSCQPAPTQTGPVAIDPGGLQDFADEFFPRQMEKLHIPGLTFIFVQGDEVVLARGYGFANLEQATPVDPEKTVMRIGSISKSFVATSVMQLVEQGKLDLHADVNQYLKAFQLEDNYPEPVTLAHLLTHTAGFEEPPYVTYTDPAQRQPLSEYLAANMPPRTHPPGEIYSYCSHGYDLAALIVEEVSGIPFDQYVKQNIFKPLGMQHSGYLLNTPLPENLATGYFYEGGGFLQGGSQIPQSVDYDNGYASGSMISTAPDMTRFLLANLQDGCYDNACILQAETLAQMHQPHTATAWEGQSVTLGFVESIMDGQTLLGHSGAIRGFGSILEFFPEHKMGYFISFNEECWQTSACEILQEFRTQFLEHFFH